MKKQVKEYVWFDGKWRRKEEVKAVRASRAEKLRGEKEKEVQSNEIKGKVSWKRLVPLDKRWMVMGGMIVLFLGLVQCASTLKAQRSFVGETAGSLYLSSKEQETVMDAYKKLQEREHALSVIKEVSDWQQQWLQDAKEELRLIQSWMEARENIRERLLFVQERQVWRKQQVEDRLNQETGDAKTLYALLLARMENSYSFSLFARSSVSSEKADPLLLEQKIVEYKRKDELSKRKLVEQMKRYASKYGMQVQEREGELFFFFSQQKDKVFLREGN
ncbi:UNVERIFIED_ORG: hypothetical protein BDK47_11827 [Anoxybacillus amylolyticus]